MRVCDYPNCKAVNAIVMKVEEIIYNKTNYSFEADLCPAHSETIRNLVYKELKWG
jgi:hypothetical protein